MKRIVRMVLVLLLLFGCLCASSEAAENADIVSGTLVRVEKSVEMKSAPKSNAETLIKIPANNALIYHQKEGNNWYKVSYQGFTGYIQGDGLILYGDIQGIRQEFSEMDDYFKDVFREIRSLEKGDAESIVWYVIMGFLIVACIATGIVSYIKKKQDDKKKRRRRAAKRTKKNRNANINSSVGRENNEEEYITNAGTVGKKLSR